MALPRCGLRLQEAKARKRQLYEDYSATRAESDLLHRRSSPGNIYKAVKIHSSVLHKVHARHRQPALWSQRFLLQSVLGG